MIANHSIPVVVDAYLKGFRNFDAEAAFQGIKTSLTVNHPKSDWDVYTKYGYLPFDIIKGESVSRVLEYAYDDYCAAQFAKALGKTDDAAYFAKRADYYKNIFCPETKFMRGRDTEGNWRTPFDPLKLNHGADSGYDYTEGNAWQYTWHVQHDPKGLIELMGGVGSQLKFGSRIPAPIMLATTRNMSVQGPNGSRDGTGLMFCEAEQVVLSETVNLDLATKSESDLFNLSSEDVLPRANVVEDPFAGLPGNAFKVDDDQLPAVPQRLSDRAEHGRRVIEMVVRIANKSHIHAGCRQFGGVWLG